MDILGTTIGAVSVTCVAIKGGLAALGFSSIGPVAGTAAASMQAAVGNVAAGSAFAFAQSLAMGSVGAIFTPVAITGAVIAGGIFAMKLF